MRKFKIIILILTMIIALFVLVGCKNDREETINTNAEMVQKTSIEPNNMATLYIIQNTEQCEHDLGYSGELTPTKLLDGISELLSYKIITNSIEIKDTKMFIDFSKESAPFNSNAYTGKGTEIYKFDNYTSLVFGIFDSIKATMQNNFNSDLEIYLSVDEKPISLDTTPKFNLTVSEPYMGSEQYLD